MKAVLGGIGVCLLVLAFTFGLAWVAQGNDFFMYKFWAPKYENTRRQVFENTQSYVDGKNQYLARLKAEYATADPAHRAALRELIISESSDINPNQLQPDVREFVERLRGDD